MSGHFVGMGRRVKVAGFVLLALEGMSHETVLRARKTLLAVQSLPEARDGGRSCIRSEIAAEASTCGLLRLAIAWLAPAPLCKFAD